MCFNTEVKVAKKPDYIPALYLNQKYFLEKNKSLRMNE